MPAGKKPPPEPVGLSLLGTPSILQSCGRLIVRQDPSAKSRDSAPPGSPSRNFQSESAANSSLGACFCAAVIAVVPSDARTKQITMDRPKVDFMEGLFRDSHTVSDPVNAAKDPIVYSQVVGGRVASIRDIPDNLRRHQIERRNSGSTPPLPPILNAQGISKSFGAK